MRVIKPEQIPNNPFNHPIFIGGQVNSQQLITDKDSKQFQMSVVNFARGARTKWHSHTSDQILIVTAGRGIVGDERGQAEVGVGDIILFPSGEKHLHGATKDSAFSHIYIFAADQKTKMLE